jgi:hypothetical protein
MKVLVAGSRTWNNYDELIRNLTVVIEDLVKKNPEDTNITFVHSGLPGAENMVTEYVGKVESYMRQKGYSIKDQVFRSPTTEVIPGYKSSKDNLMIEKGAVLAVIFLKDTCKRTETFAKLAEAYDIPTMIIKG